MSEWQMLLGDLRAHHWLAVLDTVAHMVHLPRWLGGRWICDRYDRTYFDA